MSGSVERANHVAILGGGVQLDGGVARLTPESTARADRFLDYFNENQRLFTDVGDRRPLVMCMGGAGLLASGVELPADVESREGPLTKCRLVRHGVPEDIIGVESTSISTLTNFAHSIWEELLDLNSYSPNNRLGLVSHPAHLKRAIDIVGKMGLPRRSIIPIPIYEQDNRRREWALRNGYRALLLGARDPKEMVAREERLYQVIAGVRRLTTRS